MSTLSETKLSPEQVHEIVQELRKGDYHKVGKEYFTERFERLKAAGWELGIEAFSLKITRSRRNQPLRAPKNQWRNLAHFYNQEQKIKVWYWNNLAASMAHALSTARELPAPIGNYTAFALGATNPHRFKVSLYIRREVEVEALDEISALIEAGKLLPAQDRNAAELAQVHGYDLEPFKLTQEDKDRWELP